MEVQIKVVEENEMLDDDLEMFDVTTLMLMEEQEQIAPSLKPNLIKVKPSPTFAEPVDFNSTLAEMSVIEGNELLALGNYEMAVERFREAVKYNPNSKQYQAKLLEATEHAKSKALPAKSTTSKLTARIDSLSVASLQKQELPKISIPTSVKDTQEILIYEFKNTQEIAISQSLKDTQEVSINETLAEMSFIEAEDLLSRGDQLAAVERIREAIKYNPNNSSYTQKLNKLLTESRPNKTATAKPLKEETPQQTANLAALPQEDVSAKKNTKPLKNPAKETKPKTKAELKLELAEIEGPISITTSKKPKSSKNTFLFIVAATVFIFAASLLYQSKNVTLTTVKLSYPSDQAKLNKQQLEFEWQSTGDRFLIEIESVGRPIVKAYAQETRYKLTPNQVNSIKLNTNYKWRVTPVDFKGEPVPHKTEEKWFEVVGLKK